MNEQERKLNDALDALRGEEPNAAQAAHSIEKVYDQLAGSAPAAPTRLRGQEDFHALLVPYLKGELSEARRMLVADALSKDPDLRRRYDELRGNARTMGPQLVKKAAGPSRPFIPWAIAATVLLVTGYLSFDTLNQLFAPAGPRAQLASVAGEIYKVSAAGLEPLQPGAPLGEKEAVRTAKGSSAVVRLADGSLIEMNERSELSIAGAFTGSTIRLERGNILVQAAKQKRGTLKVATRESVVNVKGTIFSVAAGMLGTQVAVVEGHVVVEQAGNREDLRPGQVTGSDTTLKRTTVASQIAWSKDQEKYLAMLGEFAAIRQQLAALPLPALRTQSKILDQLPSQVAVYAAIPNLSGTVAEASKIFEERFAANPALAKWWKSEDVAKARAAAEQLRTVGEQLGEEIVIVATRDAAGKFTDPMVVAEVKGASARAALLEMKGNAKLPVEIGEQFVVAGEKTLPMVGGFKSTRLGQTIASSYQQGAGWILAMDLEQIQLGRVSNNMQHLMVERRDGGPRPDTRATLSFSGTRTGIPSWLAEPAPMPSLDYVSPQAGFATAAVTKDAKQMGAEFLALVGLAGSQQLSELEAKLGLKVLDDLLGPLGGEVTMALDGPLAPTPAVLMAAEVYDSGRLTTSLRRVAQEMQPMGVEMVEETVNGRTWYTLKATGRPVEFHFTYDAGYVVMAPTREAITKALQNRQVGNGLARSPGFRELIPAGSPVNMSAVVYYNLGPQMKTMVDALKKTMNLPEQQVKVLDQLAASQEPVLIAVYAEDDKITVASSSGFFGFGLENLLAAGSGMPVMPTLLGGAFQRSRPPLQEGKRIQ
ncbi:MAG: FecR domain-containing protein [Bryobacter sp.]|nr:FecR domain-containing protein [Bryobacter sp.]